jgi:hypothetical protein
MHARHEIIRNQQVELTRFQPGEGGGAIVGALDDVAKMNQQHLAGVTNARFVIHQHYLIHWLFRQLHLVVSIIIIPVYTNSEKGSDFLPVPTPIFEMTKLWRCLFERQNLNVFWQVPAPHGSTSLAAKCAYKICPAD